MRHPALRLLLAFVVAILVPACGGSGDTFIIPAASGPGSGSILFVSSNNVLINVSATQPAVIISAVGLTNLPGATENIVGIDYRPATGELYGISSFNQLYRIFPLTGACVPVGPIGGLGLSGASFGIDFNPVVDRLRVVSEANQNMRINSTNAAVTVDTALTYAVADPNFGADPNVVAAAYTNNFAGALSTTLYGIDSTLDILVLQNPPNNGTLTTVGALGVDVSDFAGFDINASGTAYAALEVAGVTGLYTINLTSGAATLVGTLGTGGQTRGMTAVP